jgi:hypothetical protein
LSDGFRGFYCFNIDAIHGANLSTQITNNTVVNLHVKLIAPHLWHRQFLFRILDGIGALHLLKIIVGANLYYLPLFV